MWFTHCYLSVRPNTLPSSRLHSFPCKNSFNTKPFPRYVGYSLAHALRVASHIFDPLPTQGKSIMIGWYRSHVLFIDHMPKHYIHGNCTLLLLLLFLFFFVVFLFFVEECGVHCCYSPCADGHRCQVWRNSRSYRLSSSWSPPLMWSRENPSPRYRPPLLEPLPQHITL